MDLIFPLVEAQISVPGFLKIFRAANPRDIWVIYLFGLVQGTGVLAFTYRITLTGLSLDYSLMISLNAAVGVLVPLVAGHPGQILTTGGVTLIAGVAMLILGVCFSGKAGKLREGTAGAESKLHNFGLGNSDRSLFRNCEFLFLFFVFRLNFKRTLTPSPHSNLE
jgi:L-rhamnose-H+ transport protein